MPAIFLSLIALAGFLLAALAAPTPDMRFVGLCLLGAAVIALFVSILRLPNHTR